MVRRTKFQAFAIPYSTGLKLGVEIVSPKSALDHGLTEFDCRASLPYGDRQHHVTFSCEREG